MATGDGRPTPAHLLLLGGFLGAGKTTTILRLAQHFTAQGRRVGIITNDQGADLVDSGLVRAQGFDGLDVVGGCFCCRFDDFIARADDLIERAQPDVILAEPVGSCTDLVNTVIRPLQRLHGDRFRIAPYTVLVDPLRALEMLGGKAPSLSEKIAYIYGTQQQEAECLAVSKIDLLAPEQRAQVGRVLEERFPGIPRIEFSARTGEGFEELVEWLGDDARPARRLEEPVDYQRYADGEAELTWLDATLQVRAPAPLDLDACLGDLAARVAAALSPGEGAGTSRSEPLEVRRPARESQPRLSIGHVKMMAWPSGQPDRVAVVNVPADERPPELSLASGVQAEVFELIANLRVAGDPQDVHDAWHPALHQWLEQWTLAVEGGRGNCFTPGPPEPRWRG